MIDLEAFAKAVEAARVDIKILRESPAGPPSCQWDPERAAAVLQWMLVQIDDLTKKVAALEKRNAK